MSANNSLIITITPPIALALVAYVVSPTVPHQQSSNLITAQHLLQKDETLTWKGRILFFSGSQAMASPASTAYHITSAQCCFVVS
jgi:hypothetical protein